jgi:hypothetical protein
MRFSNDGSSWDAWVTYAVTQAWTLTAGDGTKTVYGEFKDAAGNTLADDDDINLDTTFPTGSFVINNDDECTSLVDVTLNNSVSGAAEMRFSNDGSSWDAWVTYAVTQAWTLTAGDGTKTVYGDAVQQRWFQLGCLGDLRSHPSLDAHRRRRRQDRLR